MGKEPPYDLIGVWSEVKLEIVKEYAVAYSRILSAPRQHALYHVYVDAFAGAGVHVSRARRDLVLGSPLNALAVQPPFKEYHLIDLDADKVSSLRDLVGERGDVNIYEGDCNKVLVRDVFPRIRYADYRRGLCLLDPYGLHLNWEVIQAAGKSKSIELFLNFPIADINRNVLLHDRSQLDPRDAARMTAYWGDESWKTAAYTKWGLFDFERKEGNAAVARAFQERLKAAAGFRYVPDPMPMRNSRRAIVYYLFFASQRPVAEEIVRHIFTKYRNKGAVRGR